MLDAITSLAFSMHPSTISASFRYGAMGIEETCGRLAYDFERKAFIALKGAVTEDQKLATMAAAVERRSGR